MTPMGWQQLIQRGQRIGRQLRELPAAADEPVRRQRAGAAGVRDDGQARTFRTGLLAEHFRHVEQLFDCVHAQHAHSTERGIQHGIAAGQRTRVRRGGLGGGLGATDLDQNNWLGEGDFTGGGEEGTRVAH